MSEVAPEILPNFPRKKPPQAINELLNEVIRDGIREAIFIEQSRPHASYDEYKKAVASTFYRKFGVGVIDSELEVILKSFPDQYVAKQSITETALKCIDRVDFRSFAHTSVLSPLVAINTGSGTCYAGTDKLGHLVQQGYDCWLVYEAVEPARPGLGHLFASAWSLWSEGVPITDKIVENYLTAHHLPSDEKTVEKLRKEIIFFLKYSETIKWLNPTPEFVKNDTPWNELGKEITFFLKYSDTVKWLNPTPEFIKNNTSWNKLLREVAHIIGTHQFGVLGASLDGIISYADLASNEAGLQFYLDLANDPEELALSFDITNYADCSWDEEVFKSEFLPVTKERIKEAIDGKRKPRPIYGIGIDYDFTEQRLSFSIPTFFYAFGDFEMRVRRGISIDVKSKDFREGDWLFWATDMCTRTSGLYFKCDTLTSDGKLQEEMTSERGGIASTTGYEWMFLGNASVTPLWDPELSKLSFLYLWR